MRLPPDVQRQVEDALGGVSVVSHTPLGGGCISPALRLDTSARESVFLKWSAPGEAPAGLFAEEARSLEALARTGAVRVPEVLAVHDPRGEPEDPSEPIADDARWLLLEWLEGGAGTSHDSETLGEALATLHRTRDDAFGWDSDNFIGSLPQRNDRRESWPEFWAELRLEPQVRRARDAGHLGAAELRRFERLFASLDEVLAPAAEDGPSLVHGDLWGGNVHWLADGSGALIDPAAYHGHREVDLAMSELFSGFSAGFYRGYEEGWRLAPEYRPTRRAVYQLYYLLAHVNLFGAGYVAGTLSTLREAGF